MISVCRPRNGALSAGLKIIVNNVKKRIAFIKKIVYNINDKVNCFVQNNEFIFLDLKIYG